MSFAASEDAAAWEAAIDLYQQDAVVEAWELAQQAGLGDSGRYLRWYRLIEAEALLRAGSHRIPASAWMEVEYHPNEIDDPRPYVYLLKSAAEQVAKRFRWTDWAPTTVALLTSESDHRWAMHPYGFCIEKDDGYKIILPYDVLDDNAELQEAMRHEYAHVIAFELSDGQAPRWLEEAMCVSAEESLDSETKDEFLQDPESWRSPQDLEATLESFSDDESGEEEVWLAYQQCGWIGLYLLERGGEVRMADLMRAHRGGSGWNEFWIRLRRESPTDRGLRRLFGFGVSELFDRAYQRMARSR
jgi:hypothetical protein